MLKQMGAGKFPPVITVVNWDTNVEITLTSIRNAVSAVVKVLDKVWTFRLALVEQILPFSVLKYLPTKSVSPLARF